MAIIGAIGALAAAGVGAYAANSQAQAARANNAAQQDNYLYQRRMDQRNRDIATATTRDARGNITEYIDGVGWVERPTERTRALTTASDNEELQRLRGDAMRSRLRRQNTFGRQIDEGGQADVALARAALTEQTPDQVRGNALRAALAQSAAAPNALRSAVNLTALRQGSGGETALAELGRQGMTDRRSVIATTDAAGPAAFADAENTRLSGPLQRYMALRGAATSPDDVPFAPSTLAETLTASRARQQAVAPQAMGQSANIRAPTISPVDERYGVRVGSAAAGLEGFLQSKAFRNLLASRGGGGGSGWDLPEGQYGPPSSGRGTF